MADFERHLHRLTARVLQDRELRRQVGVHFGVRVVDIVDAVWHFDCGSEIPVAERGEGSPEVVIEGGAADITALFEGTLNPQVAWNEGRLRVRGELRSALPLFRIFEG